MFLFDLRWLTCLVAVVDCGCCWSGLLLFVCLFVCFTLVLGVGIWFCFCCETWFFDVAGLMSCYFWF